MCIYLWITINSIQEANMKICTNCSNEILNHGNKFCSRKCSVSYNNKIKPKRNLQGLCKNCNSIITTHRTYCDNCIHIFNNRKGTKEIISKTCNICNLTKSKSEFYKKGNYVFSYCKKCELNRVKNQQRIFKQHCVDYKGGKCSVCGYNKCNAALDFHHLDPNEKDFSISQFKRVSWEQNKNEIICELDKCILVCSNCHRELHDSLNTSTEN